MRFENPAATVVALDDIERVPWRGSELEWRPVRAALGTTVAGMSAYTARRAGQQVVEDHVDAIDGRGHEEVYLVLEGRARFTVDGDEFDAPRGTFVKVAPEARRSRRRGRARHGGARDRRAAGVRAGPV